MSVNKRNKERIVCGAAGKPKDFQCVLQYSRKIRNADRRKDAPMKERHLKILDIVNEKERISVQELSEKLGLSVVTIRKDLEELETEGLLRRQHGYCNTILYCIAYSISHFRNHWTCILYSRKLCFRLCRMDYYSWIWYRSYDYGGFISTYSSMWYSSYV